MRTSSRRTDSLIAFGIGLALMTVALIFGDPMYMGLWYYVFSWVALVALVQITKAPPLFATGAAVALAMSFLLYWVWQASLQHPEGMLGLGHLFSLPGLGIAAVIASLLARRRHISPWAAFVVGLLACSAGFAIAQLLACRSVLYCGSLSGHMG